MAAFSRFTTLCFRRPIPRRVGAWCLMAAGGLVASLGAMAPRPSPETLGIENLGLEDLLDVRVESVSRKSESLFETAAAIGVLTDDEIRRTGAMVLPEVLRYAAGVQVSQHTSRGWAISIRGFNLDSTNKLEVLMDGRSAYSPLFSGVIWDGPDYLLADLDRIEVIRGPGATMWGANAVNGVINIYSKGSEETLGGRLETTVGAPESFVQSMRYGAQLAKHTYARVWAKYASEDRTWFENGEKSPYGDTEIARVGFRADHLPSDSTRFVMTGEYFTDKLGIQHYDYPTYEGGHLLLRWEQELANESSLNTQVYYDRYNRLYLGIFEEQRETADVSLRHRLRLAGRHDIVWGAGYRYSWDDTFQIAVPYLEPASEGFGVANFYLQDEFSWTDSFHLVLGAKQEYNSLVDRWEFQPSARAKWLTSPHTMFWAAVSRSVRTPARTDTDLRWITPNFAFYGTDDYRSEKAVSFELGHRFRVDDTFSAEISLFRNLYDDLATVESYPGNTYRYQNMQKGDAWGGEFTLEYHPVYWARFSLNYSYLDETFRLKPGSNADPDSSAAAIGNDARHLSTLGATLEFRHALELSGYLRYVDELPDPRVPAYLTLDLRLSWSPRPGFEMSLLGRNLLDDRHPEYRAASPYRNEISRSVQLQVTWAY